GPVALLKNANAAANLLGNRHVREPAIGTETSVVAIDATPHCHSAVDVGAGEAGVQGDAPDSPAKLLPQKMAQRVIALPRGKSSWHWPCTHLASPYPDRQLTRWGFQATKPIPRLGLLIPTCLPGNLSSGECFAKGEAFRKDDELEPTYEF